MASRRISIGALLFLFKIGFLTIVTRGDFFDADLDLKNYVRYEAKTGIDIIWQSSREDDPSESCNLYGYYDPEMLNITSLVTECFDELQSLVHSKFLNGEFYYTNTYYYTSDVYPWCVVICLPSGIPSSSPSAGTTTSSKEFIVHTFYTIASLMLVLALI